MEDMKRRHERQIHNLAAPPQNPSPPTAEVRSTVHGRQAAAKAVSLGVSIGVGVGRRRHRGISTRTQSHQSKAAAGGYVSGIPCITPYKDDSRKIFGVSMFSIFGLFPARF